VAELSLVLSAFRKDQMQKPRVFGLHHSHMRQGKCNRKLCPVKPYFDHHVLNAIYLQTSPCTGFVIHHSFRLEMWLRHPSTGHTKGPLDGILVSVKYSGIHRSYSLTFAQVQEI
jgi:hypothetical protein